MSPELQPVALLVAWVAILVPVAAAVDRHRGRRRLRAIEWHEPARPG